MSVELKRLPGYDINGNPRYVCHYLNLLTETEKNDPENVWKVYQGMTQGYRIAVNRAHKIGGRKYHTRAYGGGIVFQSYSIRELERDIEELVKKESGQ